MSAPAPPATPVERLATARLAAARRRIDDLDADLVRVAAERLAAAAEAGRAKADLGQSLVDFAREREVLHGVQEAAARAGLDPVVAQDLVTRLILASTSRQETELRARGSGHGRHAVVVGGAGRMGRWFTRFLEGTGHDVHVLDPAAPQSFDEATHRLMDADLVLVAVPPSQAALLYASWAQAPPRGVIADLCSVKAPLVPAMRALAAAGARVASFHPMFGPGVTVLRDADVVLCRTGDPGAEDAVRDLFTGTSARLVDVDLDEHDRLMADVLGLAHATAIAFAASLQSSVAAQGTTFRRLRDVAAAVVRENPQVYYEIQAGNPHSDSALARLEESVARLRAAVARNDEAAFVGLMAQGRQHLDGTP